MAPRDDMVRRRFIGRALLHVHQFNREALRDLFARLPDPLRVRAARTVADKLVAHASIHGDWTWATWAAHALPTLYNMTLAATFVGRLGRAGG
jgi:hypothetical protein